MKPTNIEIKAKCKNKEKIRKILESNKAVFKGTDHQIDTYFKVSLGRLKLREGNIENNLIYYERENKSGPKQSNIILLKSNPNSNLKELLTKSIGILTIVDKSREIFFIDNVKFHIDTVKNLGDFIEIEAIDNEENIGIQKIQEQCNNFKKLLDIKDADLISDSYSDLILKT